jgi:hypothetical protein
MIKRLWSRNSLDTAVASGWMYGGRVVGLMWAVLVTTELGISRYGTYAIAIALSSLIAIPLDHYFLVRGPRVGTATFLGDRSTRLGGGVLLLVLGSVLLPGNFMLGFCVGKAGGEIAFNAAKSEPIRNGHPALAYRRDTSRQVLSAVITATYFLNAEHPTLTMIGALTLLSFVPFLARAAWEARGHRPIRPELTLRTAAIVGEAVGGAVYSQADIVLVGSLASHSSAGYYAYGSLLVWSLAAVGQNYSYTFNASLREADGHRHAGPALRPTTLLSIGLGLLVAAVAVAMVLSGAPHELWLAFAILAPVTVLRTMSSVFTTVLAMQHRDHFRTGVTWVSVGVKFAILALIATHGSPAAAFAFLISDLVMTSIYGLAVHRSADLQAGGVSDARGLPPIEGSFDDPRW